MTNHGTMGESKFIGYTYGNGGEIQYTNSYKNSIDKPWYYKNQHATRVLGPLTGKLERYMTSGTISSIAITTSYADTICFYVNGQLVSKDIMANLDKFVVDVHAALRFADIYGKLELPQKAFVKLLPAIFIELADNTKVIEELRPLLKKETDLKSKLDKALQEIFVKKVKAGNKRYEDHYFRF